MNNSNKQLENSILRLLSEIRPEFDFTNSANFIEDGMLDSFDIVQLVDSLDSEFGISIDGLDIVPYNFTTLSKISGLLTKNGISL